MRKAKKRPVKPVPIRLKQNDLVEVLSGREAGKTGKILKVIRDKNQVVVEKGASSSGRGRFMFPR